MKHFTAIQILSGPLCLQRSAPQTLLGCKKVTSFEQSVSLRFYVLTKSLSNFHVRCKIHPKTGRVKQLLFPVVPARKREAEKGEMCEAEGNQSFTPSPSEIPFTSFLDLGVN